VLAEGDAKVTHVGAREGEVGFGGIGFARAGEPLPAGDPDAVAGPGDEDAWRRWLRDNGIDWDGQVV
jgi:hypothetical protein